MSIDLDAFLGVPETIYVNKHKSIIKEEDTIIKHLRKIKAKEIFYGIDHNKILMYLDQYPKCKYNIYNYDAHHDLYALNYKIWLNPLNIRGKNIDIGNMFFQLIREEKIANYIWLINDYFEINSCKKSIRDNIGQGYMSNIKVYPIYDLKVEIEFDILFISISPEWIPKDKMEWIINTINKFIYLTDNEIQYLRKKIQFRWDLEDENCMIENDRYYLEYNYV